MCVSVWVCVWVCVCVCVCVSVSVSIYLPFFPTAEAGGSEVNPAHEPHLPRGGITGEMQV